MTSRLQQSSPPPYTEFTNLCDSQTHETQIPNEPPPKYEPPSQDGFQSSCSGYQSAPNDPQMILITQQFADFPLTMQCTHCSQYITTTLEYHTGAVTWVMAGLLCLFGCWPCSPIPFCMPGLMDIKHVCPVCNKILGSYSRLN